ncbi:MAG: dynamin family protein [bacterium]|nr:dynamin family protein [bacterium]
MKYKKLLDSSNLENVAVIKDSLLSDSEIVFVYAGKNTLYDLIDNLYDAGEGLDNDYLYKFKVCYEKTDLSLSYLTDDGRRIAELTSMSALVGQLDINTPCIIVAENNNRAHLAYIIQQLIYLGFPLEKAEFFLRQDFREGLVISIFLRSAQKFRQYCHTIVRQLSELRLDVSSEICAGNPTKFRRLYDIDVVLTAFYEIKKLIEGIIHRNVTLAVAASKKAGKSVLVNCLLEEELALSSTEMATPNNCVFKRSRDDLYHLQLGDASAQDYKTSAALRQRIMNLFREAQNNEKTGFSLPDMYIEYAGSAKNRFSSYTILDTAGPDAAGTYHAEAAQRAVRSCDAAVFIIDYSKYLLVSENEYLHSIHKLFRAQNKLDALVLALNKLDVRYADCNSPQSAVMSVDFIKTRLGRIDASYRDLIVFPVSALEYFCAVEAEKAGVTELNADNSLSIDDLKRVRLAHKKDAPSLAWLHTHAENLQYYQGIETVSYDVFKKDSGLPALMSYAAYAAQKKARHSFLLDSLKRIVQQAYIIQTTLSRQADTDRERECLNNINQAVDNQLMQSLVSLANVLGAKN